MTAISLERQAGAEVRLALEAMATRFELILHGDDSVRLRAAGEEALDEIARLGRQLSFFDAASDITLINRRAGEQPVRVEPGLHRLLQRCVAIAQATDGAFDITVGPLMRVWRDAGDRGELPDEAALARARRALGFVHVRLDPDAFTVRFARPGVSVDLGAAGKGYAIDRAIDVLRGHGVSSALLHGGTSSVHAIGCPPGDTCWRVGWQAPAGPARMFALHDSALGVSAVHGRTFVTGESAFGHIMDPRSGTPSRGSASAVVTGPRSLECDALSTALLVRGPEWLHTLRARFSGYDGAAA